MTDMLESQWNKVDGRRCHAWVSTAEPRTAPDVVLVHGLGVSGRYFLPTARQLAPHCRVFVPDLPGFGLSDAPPHTLSVPELADALIAWMDAARLRAVVLIGNSMGCQIAVDCAVRYPARVTQLVLLGPTMDRAARGMLPQMLRLVVSAWYEPFAAWLVVTRDYLRCGPVRVFASLRYALCDPIEDKLPCVRVPVLLVRGERDRIAPERWMDELAERTPDVRRVTLPGASHIPNYSAAPQFVAAILPFLVDPPPADQPSALHTHASGRVLC